MKRNFTGKFHKTLNEISGFITDKVKPLQKMWLKVFVGLNKFLLKIIGLKYNLVLYKISNV